MKSQIMPFGSIHLFFVLFISVACSSEQNDSAITELEKRADSSMSYIQLNSTGAGNFNHGVNITNTIYSLESFKFRDSLRHFVCKAKQEEKGTSNWMHGNRSEKFEFFDYDFNKVFEISSNRREIELDYEYFITRSLFTDIPRIFELNSYENNEAFVKCTGTCWTAEIPNGETTAYFGYQSAGIPDDEGLQHLGTLYYGLNRDLISEVRLYFYPDQRYHGIVSISLEPKIEGDRTQYSNSDIRKLTLWSQNGKSGQEFITDFEIKVKLRREKVHKSKEYERIEYIITVKEGKLIGKDLKATDYGYQLILL